MAAGVSCWRHLISLKVEYLITDYTISGRIYDSLPWHLSFGVKLWHKCCRSYKFCDKAMARCLSGVRNMQMHVSIIWYSQLILGMTQAATIEATNTISQFFRYSKGIKLVQRNLKRIYDREKRKLVVYNANASDESAHKEASSHDDATDFNDILAVEREKPNSKLRPNGGNGSKRIKKEGPAKSDKFDSSQRRSVRNTQRKKNTEVIMPCILEDESYIVSLTEKNKTKLREKNAETTVARSSKKVSS